MRPTSPRDAPSASSEASRPASEGAARALSAEDSALSSHILTVSATLVGVCLTVIGLIRVIEELRKIQGFEDELLALDALIFLLATAFAYAALRAPSASRYRRLERAADVLFLVGLALMTLVCALIAYQVI
ncbi:MAG: hypothetical protein U0610_26045 [bacterium]